MSQVTDGTGNTWTYAYDAAGHLLSVTAPGNLTTTYTYDTGSNPETANALLSITNPDGSQQNFTYDSATGRLTGDQPDRRRRRDHATPTRARPRSWPPTPPATRPPSGTTISAWRARVQDPLGGISTYALRQQRQPGQLHRRRRRHLPVHLRPERQPDADRQPARPDRADDLQLARAT